MTRTSDSGKLGETMAAAYLTKKGYRLVDKNYRYKRYEIDLIVQQKDILVFVEVKARNSAAFGYPEEFVDVKKAQRLRRAAEAYIFDVDWQGPVRFDVVAILGSGLQNAEIRHFTDAF